MAHVAFTLRPYQKDAVSATINHFKQTNDSAVIVLPTGSGKSLVIAQLAKLAKHRILILAHVKELVEQNHAKYERYGLEASIFSAGLGHRDNQHQVTFGSVQSVAPNLASFTQVYSLIIIDECHRIGQVDASKTTQNQYQQIIKHLTTINPDLKVLGLTATPYRMGSGWIYQDHYHGFSRQHTDAIFKQCIFDMPLSLMIKQGFLTKPTLIDAAIAHYDFSQLRCNAQGNYSQPALNGLLNSYQRVTKAIIKNVIELSEHRQGVMIFAATSAHAKEIMEYLDLFSPQRNHGLILGDTPNIERDTIISQFKARTIKFLVNVAVLTTGFDAPHVDLIALLRPTQSVSLFQQIVGRGLRLSPGKDDCLIVDYANSGFDLFSPEVGCAKPSADSVAVMVPCPLCQFGNTFWGKVDEDGIIVEHYGRRCMGFEDVDNKRVRCDFRFKFKSCGQCGEENDIAARFCQHCQHPIIDPDDLLKKALGLKDAKVIRCQGMRFELEKKSPQRLIITYYDEDANTLREYFDFTKKAAIDAFNHQFTRRAAASIGLKRVHSAQQATQLESCFNHPDFIVARKQKYYWKIQEKIFDYQGNIRKANQLS